MAAKRPEEKTKGKAHNPVAYLIEVDVDISGNFKYSANGIPDASTIRPYNGDTISWSAKLMGVPVPFQVSFSGFSPFVGGTQVVRSMFGATDPVKVAVPSFYHGNLVFKYNVTIANGWSDDPDVEPVPSDGVEKTADQQMISLSIVNGSLVLDQPNASFIKGEVTWKWAAGPSDDFTLTFNGPPPLPAGWPPQTSSQAKRIALDLETAGSQNYTIQTLNLGLSSSGNTLTITDGAKRPIR
jgi:hypothetical protein